MLVRQILFCVGDWPKERKVHIACLLRFTRRRWRKANGKAEGLSRRRARLAIRHRRRCIQGVKERTGKAFTELLSDDDQLPFLCIHSNVGARIFARIVSFCSSPPTRVFTQCFGRQIINGGREQKIDARFPGDSFTSLHAKA